MMYLFVIASVFFTTYKIVVNKKKFKSAKAVSKEVKDKSLTTEE